MKQLNIPHLAIADMLALLQLAAGIAIVWTVPERHWLGLARTIVHGQLKLRRRWAARQLARLRHWVGEAGPGPGPAAILERYLANKRLAKLQVLRCRHPSDWLVQTRIDGLGHLDEALAAGSGAILWVAPLVFGPLVTKIALHRGGIACAHLSRYSHGFSKSLLGARLLNPVQTKVEARFIGERVVIGPDGSVHAAMRRLAARLRANGVVSVSAGAGGSSPVEVSFMNGQMLLATGVVGLARQTRATLLPVFTERERDGCFLTTIGSPLRAQLQVERRAAEREIAAQFARALEDRVRRQPDQFAWNYDVLPARVPK
jgi:lauroyl/myristoyl acyltransferase